MKRAIALVAAAALVAISAVIAATSDDAPSAAPSSVCGIVGVAFCDPFTGPAAGGRQGDLDPNVWQVGRVVGEVNAQNELQPFPNVPVTACKAGVTQATVDRDVLVCDSASGHAGQVLVANGAQNYGLISLSPRQPFDFAGRTGVVAANVDMVSTGPLGYWASMFVTDLPVPVASSASQVLGYLPRNGFGVTLDATCGVANGTKAGVGSVTVYVNTVETTINNSSPTCVSTARGALNHVEFRVSQTSIAVFASDPGGANLRQIFTADVTLPLSRGYVHYQTAERAPNKYSVTPGYTSNYWSKLGFDGPILTVPAASQVPDSLTSGGARGTNVGYGLQAAGLTLSIPNVAANPSSATLVMTVQHLYGTPGAVSYSLNDGPVHPATADVVGQAKCSNCPGPSGGQGVAYAFQVATSELHAGANSLRLTATGFTGSWPFPVANVELLTGGATAPPTTIPASSTSGPATTAGATTSASATTVPAPTTTVPVSGACRVANAVFCETFDQAHNGGTRTGDLDPVLWGVSRLGQWNDGNGQHNRLYWPTITQCGANGPTAPPGDVRICNGKMFEGVNDGHNVASLHTYPKQPFDFAGRTGIATFDVSADSEGPHGAWPEFVITDKPVPGTRSDISNTGGTSGNNDVPPPTALNEVGIALDGGCVGQQNTTGVGLVFVTRNGAFQEQPFTQTGCVQKGSLTSLNHFEVRVSQNHLEVWGTDAGATTLKQLAVADGINLTLTRGLVWLDDVHYNADKFPNPVGQRDHQFAWDNLGFDGPPTYRDLGFDVADANNRPVAGATDLGYFVGAGQVTLPTATVRSVTVPTAAQVVFNYTGASINPPQVSVNGNPFITTANPFSDSVGFLWRSLSVPIPYSQVNDARTGGTGANTVTFKSSDGQMQVTNITLILVAADVVPGGTTPPTTTVPATTVPATTSTLPATTSTTIPATTTSQPATTTTVPGTTTTTIPAPVNFPDGYTGDIFVGGVKIWPPDEPTTTTVPAATTTQPAAQHFGMLPVGAALPSDATCASLVRPATEVRPANTGANHTAPSQTKVLSGRLARVTGNFQGTTDELIQWAACKWGIDEDMVRAQVVIESWWYQSATGDYTTNSAICAPGHMLGSDGRPGQCPESVGLLQTRWQYMKDAFPSAGTSSAYQLDVALGFRRQCFEGDDTWLNTVERGRDYAAGDIWGCMGTWFAGRWYTDPAVTYIGRVQDTLAQRTWETPDFLGG